MQLPPFGCADQGYAVFDAALKALPCVASTMDNLRHLRPLLHGAERLHEKCEADAAIRFSL